MKKEQEKEYSRKDKLNYYDYSTDSHDDSKNNSSNNTNPQEEKYCRWLDDLGWI